MKVVTEPVAVATPLSAAEFPAVYAAELGYVWNALRRLGVQERDLEDLCHDVFVSSFATSPVYDTRRPIRPGSSASPSASPATTAARRASAARSRARRAS